MLNECFSNENMEKQLEELKVEDESSWVFITAIKLAFM